MEDRVELLNSLVDKLTINEAASLVARIHAKNAEESGLSKGKRFGLYPITDWEGFTRTKRLEASFWQADEVEFYEDLNDFESMTYEEQMPLLMAFGFFAVGDGSISSMLAYQMILIAENFENQLFYVKQLDNETVHGEVYGKMIYTLVTDPKRRDDIFNAVENVKSIGAMNSFIEDSFTYPDGKRQLYISLAASEYLMFTPLFCIIFWYRAYRRGMIPKVIFSNEQIAKDEAAHCMNGVDNYNNLSKDERYTDEEIHVFVDKVVSLVSDFADEICTMFTLTDLTAENIRQYVRYVADDLFDRAGHTKYYDVKNPFKWMDFTKLVPKTNFYEGTVGEYRRFNVDDSVKNAYRLCNGLGPEKKEEKNVYDRVDDIKF